jgi:hypothetical protein
MTYHDALSAMKLGNCFSRIFRDTWPTGEFLLFSPSSYRYTDHITPEGLAPSRPLEKMPSALIRVSAASPIPAIYEPTEDDETATNWEISNP